MKSGIYGHLSELSPKYNWDYGQSKFVGKKDFTPKKDNYKLYG